MVTAIVIDSRAEVESSVTVMGPRRSLIRAEMGDAELARGVEGMGTQVNLVSM